MKKRIASLILISALIIPTQIDAKSISTRSASSSTRSVSRAPSSSLKSSVPRVSSTPKSSTVKPATSKMKISTSKPKIDTTKKTDVKLNMKKTPVSKTDTKKVNVKRVDKKINTNEYSVKPKYSKSKKVYKTYYNNYPEKTIYVNSGSNFWTYYGLSHMLNGNNITERALANELENKGYSEDEAKKIVKDARKENKKKSKLSGVIFKVIGIGSISVLALLFLKFKKNKLI